MRQPLSFVPAGVKAIVGMVHLLPLPGSHRWRGSMQEVLDRALADAHALAEGGVHAIMVENFGDTPFIPEAVPAVTVAAMTTSINGIRRELDIPVGVNVLRNDAAAALGICAATGASFIRVNVHAGAMLTDQGWISGRAHETLRLRAQLALDVAILADVLVKHATPPAGLTLEDAAMDTWQRAHADALIISGSGTGRPTKAGDVTRVHDALPDAQLLIGSGLTVQNAAELLAAATGAIVGTAFKTDQQPESPVDRARVQAFMEIVAKTGVAAR